MREELENYNKFKNKIADIIGYRYLEEAIEYYPATKWGRSDDGLYFNFDRGDEPMEEYDKYQISSLGTLQDELFCGEKDGFFFVMGHEEDGGWDSSIVFVFDNANKVKFKEPEW